MSNQILVVDVNPNAYQSMLPADVTDEIVIEMWLSKGKRSPHTQNGYRRDIGRFLTYLKGKPLQSLTLSDVQQFQNSLRGKPNSRNRHMATIKSLLSFGAKTGYLQYNVGSLIELDDVNAQVTQRILPEAVIVHMIMSEPDARNRAMLHLLYACGLRAAEVVSLNWDDLIPREHKQGQITVVGKGNKVRHLLIEPDMYQELLNLKAESIGPALFTSHGAPIGLVQATLGHASLTTTSKYIHARPTDSIGTFLPM